LLKTGAREKEGTHAEWTDINWAENAITIRGEKNLKVLVGAEEKKLRFRTKTRRSRDITLEEGLLLSLKAWRKKNPSARFIFGTTSDLPDGTSSRPARKLLDGQGWTARGVKAELTARSAKIGSSTSFVRRLPLGHSKVAWTSGQFRSQWATQNWK
jgi:integrase